MQKIVAILPMRDGSQRVINKNSRVINGKHLYEYIIDKLLNFNLISNIIINTDIEMVHEKYISNHNHIDLSFLCPAGPQPDTGDPQLPGRTERRGWHYGGGWNL